MTAALVMEASIATGDTAGQLSRIPVFRDRAIQRTGNACPITTSQEAGLDGIWPHRVLMNACIESNVRSPASNTVSRRRRRAKDRSPSSVKIVHAALDEHYQADRRCVVDARSTR